MCGMLFTLARLEVLWIMCNNLVVQVGMENKRTTGQKLAHCETDVKNFAKTNDCFRKALLKPLDLPVDSVNPLHNCCSNCKKMCTCNGNDCSSEELPFTQCNINSQEK